METVWGKTGGETSEPCPTSQSTQPSHDGGMSGGRPHHTGPHLVQAFPSPHPQPIPDRVRNHDDLGGGSLGLVRCAERGSTGITASGFRTARERARQIDGPGALFSPSLFAWFALLCIARSRRDVISNRRFITKLPWCGRSVTRCVIRSVFPTSRRRWPPSVA
ncbi:hypothetical protein LY76DRAFT_176737 [Colletotrichum caudatum]|nr:hypothetical protein LY76DRAFT_176737 [Colletotrichum caudatum]